MKFSNVPSKFYLLAISIVPHRDVRIKSLLLEWKRDNVWKKTFQLTVGLLVTCSRVYLRYVILFSSISIERIALLASLLFSLSLFEERNLEELSVNVALGPRVIYARASLLFLDVSFSLSLSFFFIPRLELAF